MSNDFSSSWYMRHLAKEASKGRHAQPAGTSDGCSIEADLHQQIKDHCKSKGWKAHYCRMDKPTTCGVGDPDFIIAADKGRTFYIEAKTKTGKLTEAQMAAAAWLRKLGHEYHIVRSYQQFVSVVTTPPMSEQKPNL